MHTSLLDDIPIELLARVAEYVGLAHRPSLLSFALASKCCHSVAKRLFFHTIRFSVSTATQLEVDVGECTSILERNASFSDVRILLITGHGWNKNGRTDTLPSAQAGRLGTRSWSFGLPLSVDEIVDGDKDRLQGLERRSALVPSRRHRDRSDRTSPDITILMDTAWQALVGLVRRLQGLGDVLYAVPSQLPPPCLVQVLPQYQPHCRLHVFTFSLRSLHLSATDPHRLALVTTPCLHGIWVRYTIGYDYDDQPDHHFEAVYCMVRGLAPNLKEVHLFQERFDEWSYEDAGTPLAPLPPSDEGFTSVGKDLARMPDRLESLGLGLHRHPTESRLVLYKDVVEQWAATTQLSCLRDLRISRAVSERALLSLLGVKGFPSLTTLLFTCAERQDPGYYDDVKQFIQCLPQLSSLEVIEWPANVSLTDALPPGLRELWLRPQDVLDQNLSEAAIAELAARCPRIGTLAVTIRRSRGDAAEVALYQALGRFANLRRLDLTLDASPPAWFQVRPPDKGVYYQMDTHADPSFDDFDRQHLRGELRPYRNGHLRDVFVNTAVDETLARAIFETICAASAAPALERVVIQPDRAEAFPQRDPGSPLRSGGLSPFVLALGRRWLLERDVRDDARHVVHAREIDGERRLRLKGSDLRQNSYWGASYMSIFRRIWPEGPDASANWYDDWRSWPLAETA
ncbi:hypothetical protein N658DRAFT_485340 [Parathielavia hyrcaniae]|uniref:Uncharacterized protein n=1 Tax=Parathielavia hyrcaniae TaxID=113614 RepID=A0AAN6T2C7_9PEZI|nr:hypothetical protein N658DRAFT_485340 [Parathielavia hyrcaniae]